MSEAVSPPDFNSPIVHHARKDFPLLDAGMSVADALERIRREGVGERVIYFFATDAEKRLVGVLPTRRLLTAPLEMQMRAARAGLRILEVPVRHQCRTGGVSKVSGTLHGTFVAGTRIIATLLRIAFETKTN
jgi:uncharacterized protein YqjF (DUF2071 family)